MTQIRGNSQIMAGTIDSGRLEANFLKSKTLVLSDDQSAVIRGLAAPTQAYDAVNKQYADSLSAGLDPKQAVKAATIGSNLASLSGTMNLDDVALGVGDRVLVKDQTNKINNGIYVVASGPWTRASDFDGTPDNEVKVGAYVFVQYGTVNASAGFIVTGIDDTPADGNITVGTEQISFAQFNGAYHITAGDGLTKVGNTLSVVASDLVKALSGLAAESNNFKVILDSTGNQGLTFNAAGEIKVVEDNIIDTAYALKTDGTTKKIQINVDSAGGLQIASSAIGIKLNSAALALSGSGLAVVVDNSSIEVNSSNGLQVKADGIKDTMIDFGHSTGQVDAADIPFDPTGTGYASATTNVDLALKEALSLGGGAETTEYPTVTNGNAAIAALTAPASGKTILESSIKVFLNGLRNKVTSDYTYNSTSRVITFTSNLVTGDAVIVDYKIVNS